MSAICDGCGAETTRYVMKFYDGRAVHSCHICEHPRHSSTVNPYADMVIEHVRDEEGKPLRVTSRRQLEEAEKKYHFRSLVAHTWEENFDKPPKVAAPTLQEAMFKSNNWLYPDVAKAMIDNWDKIEAGGSL